MAFVSKKGFGNSPSVQEDAISIHYSEGARSNAGPFAVFWSKGIKGSEADFFVGFATVMARFAVSVANFVYAP